MRKAILLISLFAPVSAFADKDLVSVVKPVVKHPAVLTRSYKGVSAVGKHVVYPVIKPIGKVFGKLLF